MFRFINGIAIASKQLRTSALSSASPTPTPTPTSSASSTTNTQLFDNLEKIYIAGLTVGVVGSSGTSIYLSYTDSIDLGAIALGIGFVTSLVWPISLPIISANLIGSYTRNK